MSEMSPVGRAIWVAKVMVSPHQEGCNQELGEELKESLSEATPNSWSPGPLNLTPHLVHEAKPQTITKANWNPSSAHPLTHHNCHNDPLALPRTQSLTGGRIIKRTLKCSRVSRPTSGGVREEQGSLVAGGHSRKVGKALCRACRRRGRNVRWPKE